MPLLIRIDLVPGGDYREAREIARGWITNEMTNPRGPDEGDYEVHLESHKGRTLFGHAKDVRRVHINVWHFLHALLEQTDFG